MNKCCVGWYIGIAIRFSKGSSSLEVVDLRRLLKEWDVMRNRKVLEGREQHENTHEAGVSTSAWGDRCAGRS